MATPELSYQNTQLPNDPIPQLLLIPRAFRPIGGEGRTRTFEAARATDLQSAAFDRFATSPIVLC